MKINTIKFFQVNKNNFKSFHKTSVTFGKNEIVKDFFEKKDNIKEFPLIEKYGLNIDEIGVKSVNPVDINRKQKAIFIERLLEAHELAKKNVETGNIVQLGYATNLCLCDDTWHLATNFNNTRNDISCLCGERSAVIVAYNDFLKNLIKNNDVNYKQEDFKIKYLAMSSAKNIGEDYNASAPCADCLSWLNTNRFFDDKTKVVFFVKDEKSSKLFLEFKTLKELLPMREIDLTTSKTDARLEKLPFIFSDEAKKIIDKKEINKENILNTLKEAKNAFDASNFSSYSGQKIGVGIRVEGKFYKASKVDWSKRWFVEPLEIAIVKSAEDLNKIEAPEIIAYWGDNKAKTEQGYIDDGIISLRTFGRIKAIDKEAEPLITVVVGDKIEVYSINDFIPKKSTFKQGYMKALFDNHI